MDRTMTKNEMIAQAEALEWAFDLPWENEPLAISNLTERIAELRDLAADAQESEPVAYAPPSDYDWMPEARQLAAQCWCDPETKHNEMDVVLAEAMARRIAAWMQTGAFHARNEEYWRDRAHAAEARPDVSGARNDTRSIEGGE